MLPLQILLERASTIVITIVITTTKNLQISVKFKNDM